MTLPGCPRYQRERPHQPMCVVSADSRCGAPFASYRSYLERAHWDALDQLIATSSVSDATPAGTYDFQARLEAMDHDGIAGEVVRAEPDRVPWRAEVRSPRLRAAGARAYHRWLADQLDEGRGRIAGVFEPASFLDLDTAAAELRWWAHHGFVAAGMPGGLANESLPPLYSHYYEPYWRACDDNGLPLVVHSGHRLRQDSPSELGIERVRQVFWQLMLGGVFDRHRGLTIAFTGVRAGWVPGLLAYLDRRFAGSVGDLTPSEYFRERCMITPSSIRPIEVAMRRDIGADLLMFGTDYPRRAGTWPNSREWIQATFGYQAVSEIDTRRILGDNAIDYFRLDRRALEEAARRVGPRPVDVLRGFRTVDPRLIHDFDERSGFNEPMDDPMGRPLPELLEEDVDAVEKGRRRIAI